MVDTTHNIIGSGDFTQINMSLEIGLRTESKCVNVSTIYDNDPMNLDEEFTVTLSSSDLAVFIPLDRAVTSVIIENSELILPCRSSYNNIMSLFLLVPPPDIEPMINKVTEGMVATFTVNFFGVGTAFQWQLKEENITEEHAQMRSLTITPVTDMDEGNYTCIVTFSFGEKITSKMATLLVCKINYDSIII